MSLDEYQCALSEVEQLGGLAVSLHGLGDELGHLDGLLGVTETVLDAVSQNLSLLSAFEDFSCVRLDVIDAYSNAKSFQKEGNDQ